MQGSTSCREYRPAARGEALIGRELGDYRITALIAEGGMSRVYRAERIDGSFERDVAMSTLPASGLSREFRDRLLRRAGRAGRTQTTRTSASCYDAQVTEEGWPYIVMEFVDGAPVDEWCRERAEGREAVVRLTGRDRRRPRLRPCPPDRGS
ncbi:MAG: hypothetical protein U5K38_11565 [Woeseiaceae bacterium]|nr:hypothetical protein [Woeseiaceae bacterium]